MNSTMKSLISSTGSNCIGPARIHSRAPLTSWPNSANATNRMIEPRIQMYLYAASTRKRAKAGPAAIESTSEKATHTICFWARSGSSRATTARPIDESTTASAGSVSSRVTETGRSAGQASASAASANGSQTGTSAAGGAKRSVAAAIASATIMGAQARTRAGAPLTRG